MTFVTATRHPTWRGRVHRDEGFLSVLLVYTRHFGGVHRGIEWAGVDVAHSEPAVLECEVRRNGTVLAECDDATFHLRLGRHVLGC